MYLAWCLSRIRCLFRAKYSSGSISFSSDLLSSEDARPFSRFSCSLLSAMSFDSELVKVRPYVAVPSQEKREKGKRRLDFFSLSLSFFFGILAFKTFLYFLKRKKKPSRKPRIYYVLTLIPLTGSGIEYCSALIL